MPALHPVHPWFKDTHLAMSEWPVSPVPPKGILRKIAEGYVLTLAELTHLKADRKTATELENTDQNFNREARKYRAEKHEEDRIKKARSDRM